MKDFIGPWLSAALEDPFVCEEMKAAIMIHFEQQRELNDYLKHVKKCLIKNGEYAPLSHETIDRMILDE
ncbi:hypothetical protein NVW32_004635 [Salmonella enterica]|nr:hypothetical protein [Salmonella enterica]EJT0199996.1 hypothetical protein [Salmonella enterica]